MRPEWRRKKPAHHFSLISQPRKKGAHSLESTAVKDLRWKHLKPMCTSFSISSSSLVECCGISNEMFFKRKYKLHFITSAPRRNYMLLIISPRLFSISLLLFNESSFLPFHFFKKTLLFSTQFTRLYLHLTIKWFVNHPPKGNDY